MMRALALACVWLIAVLGAVAGSARTIVLSSRGPSAASYPAGTTLRDPLEIAIKAGDTLTLLDGSGTTVLKGPKMVRGRMSAALSPQDYALISTLAQARPKRMRVAGVSFNLDRPPGGVKGGYTMNRTPASAPQDAAANRARPAARPSVAAAKPAILAPAEPGLWDIDPASGARWCIQAGGDLSLFRSVAGPALELTATPQGGAPVSGTWSPDANRLSLPVNWASAQTDLRIGWRAAGQGSAERSYELTVNRIDDAPGTIAKLALALDAAECDVQLARLETIYRASPTAP